MLPTALLSPTNEPLNLNRSSFASFELHPFKKSKMQQGKREKSNRFYHSLFLLKMVTRGRFLRFQTQEPSPCFPCFFYNNILKYFSKLTPSTSGISSKEESLMASFRNDIASCTDFSRSLSTHQTSHNDSCK